MATKLPTATRQDHRVAPVVDSPKPNIFADAAQIIGATAPAFDRAARNAAARAGQERKDADDAAIGEMIIEQNQIDLDRQIASAATSDLQTASMNVARAREDGEITEEEQVVVDDFLRQQKQLDQLKQQKPTAFSSDKSFIQKSLKFQAALRQNPRLASKLVSARNSLSTGPSKVSGAQVQEVVKIEQEIAGIYGANPTPAQRVEFSEFKLMERNNLEMANRNKIKADAGQLTADAIFTAATANLDLNITKIDTAFINDQNAGGGFAKSDRVEQYVSQLRLIQKDLENQVYQEVANQNKNGRGLIQRDVVAARLKPIQEEIAARIEIYQDRDSSALLTKIDDFQKKYLAVNGGNAVTLARQISGVRGDNVGSLAATINLMGNQDPTVKNGFANLMGQSGMSALTQSVDTAAANLAGMMNSGIPLPKNLQAAGVYHGVLSMREGPVSENVKEELLRGVSTIGLEESIPAAVKILSEDSTARQLSGPQLKQTVDSLSSQVSNSVRSDGLNVAYDVDTDKLIVFKQPTRSRRGQMSRQGPPTPLTLEDLLKTTDTTVRGRGFISRDSRLSNPAVDNSLTEDLNAVYSLHESGKYASDLKSGEEFLKFWLDTYGLETNDNNTNTEVSESDSE